MTAPGEETRARILETAWQQVRERGTADVTIAQIAAAAGVSRQLVYFHFANRAGLLTAMARHRDQASGFAAEAAHSRAMAPIEGSSTSCAPGAPTCPRSSPSLERSRPRSSPATRAAAPGATA